MGILTKEQIGKILDETEQLVDSNNFTAFYKYLYKTFEYNKIESVSEMTDFLLMAGINPLEYMKEVPIGYLFGNQDIISVDIPANIEVIKRSAFQNSSIKEVTFEGAVKGIGAYAFEECSELKNIKLPDGIEVIEDGAFALSGLESLEIPASVKKIGMNVITGKCIPTYLGTEEQWKSVERPLQGSDAINRKIQIVG